MVSSDDQNFYEWGSDHSDEYDSDDSQRDPTFDIFEGTRSKFSSLSINKKSKPRLGEGNFDFAEGKGDQTVEEVIKAGQLEKLKVDQCKVYLRKHGLRLTGNKDILIQRIREHLDVIDGGGERKYPVSSFLVNCKGDACAGDAVLFEQNVYEMFNIASRSANGPPCGTRLVAGRIVKESYGAEKQQHTFTIEVLWSKGEKPLPPLHQLLIKGRNLYRLQTMRQEWEDETERQKMLSEKHARGYVARSKRDIRVQEREMWKMRRLDRMLKAEGKKKQPPINITSKTMEQHPQQPPEDKQRNLQSHNFEPTDRGELRSCNDKISARQEGSVSVQIRPENSLKANVSLERHHHHLLGRPPLTSMNCNLPRDPPRTSIYEGPIKFNKSMNSVHGASHYERNTNHNSIRSPLRANGGGFSSNMSPTRRCVNEVRAWSPKQVHFRGENFVAQRNPVVQGHLQEKQSCRYYAKGRCYYGDKCKWLHQGSGNLK